jgi:homoserine O-succinyltransferase
MSSRYAPVGDLWNSAPHALIVTGAEPTTAQLSEEPYWRSLSSLVDWAERSTISSVWSCLAAHAAVLHLDGIERRPLSKKLVGVFACNKASEGPLADRLVANIPDQLHIPHSRWNDVSVIGEGALVDGGYRILTRSDEAGADAFIRQGRSLFLLFQGHPEYEADTLLLEYRRDIRRFLAGQSTDYPTMPSGYFDEESTAALCRYRKSALSAPRENLLNEFPTSMLAARARDAWKAAAVAMYRNWLTYLWEERSRRGIGRSGTRIRHGADGSACGRMAGGGSI